MFKDENRHYSLRKLSVGLASVLIGISFASTTGNSVKADMVNGSNSAQTVVKSNNVAAKIDAKSASEGQSQTPEAVKKDSDAITQDSKQDTVNAKVMQQNAAAQGSDSIGDKAEQSNTGSVVQDNSSAKGNSLADAIQFASIAGSLSVQKFGAQGGMPTIDALKTHEEFNDSWQV